MATNECHLPTIHGLTLSPFTFTFTNRREDVLKVDADEDGIGGDDAADALRYLVATRSREIRVRKLRGI